MTEREREYAVTEFMETYQTFYVRAKSREDAIRRVEAQECADYVETGPITPARRKMSARWIRRRA